MMRPAAAQGEAGEGAGYPMTLDADALRGALAPLVRELLRESIAPVHGRQLPLTTAALEDAHARIRQLEKEMGELRRELGAAQAARDLAGEHVNAMFADLREAIAASGRDAESLARAAGQLTRTERYLKAQNDALRLQVSAEAEALRTQNRQLRERIGHLIVDNDRYRRAIARRGTERS
jgi:hypothetical protein